MLVDAQHSAEQAAAPERKRTQAEREAEMWLNGQLARGRLEYFSVIADLTVELASPLLGRNAENRPVSQTVVARYARDITNGHWELNGEGLLVSADGLLNDGQHRCHAVLSAGRPIRTIIAFGLSRDSRLTLDQGRQRTVWDYFSMDDVPHAKSAASVCRLAIMLEETGKVSAKAGPTKQQCREYYHRHRDEIERAIAATNKQCARNFGGEGFMSFVRLVLNRANPERAAVFFDAMETGAMLSAHHPALTLRQRLMDMKGVEGRRTYERRFEAIVRAWNAYCEGRRLTKIQLMDSLPPIAR